MMETGLRRCVEPPASDGYVRPPALLAVDIADDEEIEWIWTHYIDGRSVVGGYRIMPKRDLLRFHVEAAR
jgi:hypothetical protein